MLIKEIPTYASLLEKAERYPDMDILATEAYLHALRSGTLLHTCAERILARQGLSRGRCLLLSLLSTADGPLPVGKLADLAGVTTPTVSAVLAGMVRDGLVERTLDPADRRLVRIGLTQEGQQVLDEVLPVLFEHHARVVSQLTKEELRTLIELLSKVRLKPA
ncbi:MarR family winged helix-turn-helix transcriptional regulator [Fundidesulfovibrio terrae]|uniref:MarR family winged helix-turn-helix transcriptional regulator n=1 Tax=Fundidesulfovibrio terrae TaxID=2922866 RepID=UPI001FAF0094|nr:MarR family transcriptional regulator [Fundidesulfovibrio terrae]